MNTAANSSNIVRFQAWVLLIGLLLMAGKFAAWYLTGSVAILTDALESIVNIVAGGIALYSVYLSEKPSDYNHPYGHGKVEFVSASVEGVLIIIAGGTILVKAVYQLFVGIALARLDLGLAVTAVAGLVNFLLGVLLRNKGQKTGSPTLLASGAHLKSDAYSSAGLVAGLLVIWFTEIYWLDSMIAIGLAVLIMYTGYKVIRNSLAGIMDEQDYELLRQIITALNNNRRENWIDVHNLRVIKYGRQLHVDGHLTLPWYLNLEASHKEVKKFEDLINNNLYPQVEFFVHTDPCRPRACPICNKSDCPVRHYPKTNEVEWTLDNLMRNRHHF